MKRVMAGIVAAALLAAPAAAEVLARAGDLVVADGTVRSAGPMARSGAGYFTVTNEGSADDRLIEARSEAGQRVELHRTTLENGVARMGAIEDGIAIPAGETVALEQGGDHLMFMGLTEAWDEDAGVPVTLVFERAGEVELVLPVTAGPAGAHGGHGG
jgi:periplasmic copper chaperone A